MEPRREEPTAPTPPPQEKPRRFRIVKLEERIAPSNSHGQGNVTHSGANCFAYASDPCHSITTCP
jgi:hypothetical protein